MLTRRLLDRFPERGLRICRLEVRAANAVAIDLYERLRFHVIGASPAPIAVPPSKPALAPTTVPVPGLPKAAPIGAPAAAPRAVPIAAGCGVPPPH